MKKRMSIALALLLSLILLVAACAPSDPEETDPVVTEPGAETTEPVEEPGEKTKISFAVQADSTPALDALIEAFNEQSDMYEAEATIMSNDSGQMHDQLLNSLSAQSSEYDVISMDVVWAGEFAAAGFISPLDDLLVENGWTPADFNAGSMASGRYSGRNYVLPYFPDLGFIYYRSDIVSEEDAATLESGEYSWDDYLAMAEKYQGEDGTEYGMAYQAMQYEGLTVNVNEFTGNWTDIAGGLERMKSTIDDGLTPPDILNYTEGETANALLNGETVFARNWPYVNGMLQSGDYDVKIEQVSYAPLPEGGSVGGWLLGVSSYSNNPEGARAFISFVAGPEGQKINAVEGSYLPGFDALLEDEDVLESNALLSSTGFQTALANTISRPVVANYSEVSDEIQIATHEYLTGNSDLESAVAAIEAVLPEE
ncbi:MAG: extracellular solute-binding protein [Fastidiosipila sp.]|nr:extracellular solute-binding protein [Fastidiosipila sp.]